MSDPAASSPFINPREFDTELQAVWFAANYYYEASFRRRKEYSGVVFQKPNGKFSLTIRRDGQFHQSKVRIDDAPADGDLRAIWHTHIPYTQLSNNDDIKIIALALESIEDLLGGGFENFSTADKRMAEDLTQQSLKIVRRRFPIYLITASVIKRYTPGAKTPEKTWSKEPPGKMKKIW